MRVKRKPNVLKWWKRSKESSEMYMTWPKAASLKWVEEEGAVKETCLESFAAEDPGEVGVKIQRKAPSWGVGWRKG